MIQGDIRFLLLLGAGVVAASWALFNAPAVAQLVGTGTNGYISMVRGLESPQGGGGVSGGAGNFPSNVISAAPSGSYGYG